MVDIERGYFVVKKLAGLLFLISTFIVSLLFVRNFFYPIPVASTRPPISFMENTFGIYEPEGSLMLLFLATFFRCFMSLNCYFSLHSYTFSLWRNLIFGYNNTTFRIEYCLFSDYFFCHCLSRQSGSVC